MAVLDKIISVFAPQQCLGCGIEGNLLCQWCREEHRLPLPPRCYRCRRLSEEFRVCSSCRSSSKLGHVWVVSEYEGIFKQLISEFKFERAQSAAKIIADIMASHLPFLDKDTVVSFVPTAAKRRRQRGYDHAALIAKDIARQKDLTFVPLMARIGDSRQVGASREVRLKQLKSAFRPLRQSRIQGAKILIVDDIVTTGGTLEAVAGVLRAHGANRVDAVVLAQKM